MLKTKLIFEKLTNRTIDVPETRYFLRRTDFACFVSGSLSLFPPSSIELVQ